MILNRKLTKIVATGLVLASTVLTGAVALPQVTQAATPVVGFEQRGGQPGGQNDTFLAEALGITAEQLAAAQESARLAGIQQALDEGLITQAQADALRERTGRGGLRGGFFGSDQIDQEALLADALNITTERLQEARKTANAARVAQAVADGRITQADADLMKAEQALADYFEQKNVFGNAVQQAVTDGVITQAQADEITSRAGGRGLGFHFGGRGGHGGADMGGRMLRPGNSAAPNSGTPQPSATPGSAS